MTLKEIQNELDQHPRSDQLLVAYWILEGAVQEHPALEESAEGLKKAPVNPLLSIAGRFSGKPDNVSERAEEILMNDANKASGFRIDA